MFCFVFSILVKRLVLVSCLLAISAFSHILHYECADHEIHPQTAEFLKYYVVEKRVITLSVLDNDTMDTLLGPQHKMLFTVSDSMVGHFSHS